MKSNMNILMLSKVCHKVINPASYKFVTLYLLDMYVVCSIHTIFMAETIYRTFWHEGTKHVQAPDTYSQVLATYVRISIIV